MASWADKLARDLSGERTLRAAEDRILLATAIRATIEEAARRVSTWQPADGSCLPVTGALANVLAMLADDGGEAVGG
jgi:hypothetical protein